eukprot:SAG31_NODE_11021_length_1073_cov_1.530801_1_plen_311_part_10
MSGGGGRRAAHRRVGRPAKRDLRLLLLFGIIHHLATVTANPAAVVIVPNSTNINNVGTSNAIAKGENTTWVKFLGTTDSIGACGDLCMRYGNESSPCRSFTRYKEDKLAGKCFGHLDYNWLPVPIETGWHGSPDSGLVTRACRNHLDCSLNGKCDAKTGQCTCNQAWHGMRCEALKLAPVDRDAIGFSPTLGGLNMTSWGGSVHQVNGRWHMWASRMDYHCGIGQYLLNSRVVHAVAPPGAGPSGPYEEAESIVPPFAHEPSVARAPAGELVMVTTAGSLGDFSGRQCQCNATPHTGVCACNNSCHPFSPT